MCANACVCFLYMVFNTYVCRCSVCVCVCFCACVWSHLAGVFLEGNKSICYKKAACDLTPGPCCSLPLSARRARDIARLRRREREGEREKWNGMVGRKMEEQGGSERCQDRERERGRENCRFCSKSQYIILQQAQKHETRWEKTVTARSCLEKR